MLAKQFGAVRLTDGGGSQAADTPSQGDTFLTRQPGGRSQGDTQFLLQRPVVQLCLTTQRVHHLLVQIPHQNLRHALILVGYRN